MFLATNDEIKWINNTLEESKRRPLSSDFLDSFPWESVSWYKAKIEYTELKNFFFFWDGSAWGEDAHWSYRLQAGVEAFRRIEDGSSKSNNIHLNQIIGLLKEYRNGSFQTQEIFLLLAGLDQNSRLMVIDGNHRVAAALWWAMESGDQRQLPLYAWLGLSPDMLNYKFYRRIVQSEGI